MPRLALRLPSIGSQTTVSAVAAVAEDAPAQLLRDEGEARRNPLEPGDDRRLGRGVHRGRLVAALAVADTGLALQAGRQLVEHPADGRCRVAADLEPVGAGHSSKGERRSPLVSLGKKYVLFCGMRTPARANSSTCSTVGGRTRNAAVA